jgi:hypothetical protein
MSNRVHFVATMFVDVVDGSQSFGYRAFDDYESCYGNHWDSSPKDQLEFLRLVVEEDSEVVDQLCDHIRETRSGAYINGDWYEIEQIEAILSPPA